MADNPRVREKKEDKKRNVMWREKDNDKRGREKPEDSKM